MLARLRSVQRDGRHRQADDDFRGWVKITVLFLAVSGPRKPFVVSNGISRFSISDLSPEILALKVAVESGSHRKQVVFGPEIIFLEGQYANNLFVALYYRSIQLSKDK